MEVSGGTWGPGPSGLGVPKWNRSAGDGSVSAGSLAGQANRGKTLRR